MITLSTQNEQLIEKYKNDEAFSSKMDRISQRFHQYQQLAVYKELMQNSKVLISIKSNDEESWSCKRANRINIQVVIGKRQPSGKNSIENLLLSIIKFFPRPTQPFSFLYINTLADKNAYSDFKKVVDFLPIQYLSFLDKVYVLQVSFMSKAFEIFSFDYIFNYFRNKTDYVSQFQEMASKIGLNASQFLPKLPIQIAKQLNKSSLIIQKNKVSSSAIKLLSKDILVLKSLQDYESGKTGAPLIIQLLLYYLKQHKEYLDVEGLFRKSANIQEETLLLKELQKQNYNYLQTISDPHLVANAIKRFLSNLAQPIVPYQHFNTLMACPDEKLAIQTKKVVHSLPNHRKMTLFLTVEFLKEKLIPRTNYNQMNQDNLSIVIGPCLMRSQVASLKDLAYASKIVNVMKVVFKDFEMIFGSKKERMNLIRCSVREQEGQELKQKLGGLQQQYLQLQKAKLTEQEQQNLDDSEDFLAAFNKK